MVSIRKRRYDDQGMVAEEPPPQQPVPPPMLVRLRNMWQFSCLFQWLYIFGGVVKLANLDIDELEAQCLNPHSTVLQDIGLALLKFLSSHRGLTHELFDEYTRRQYMSKAPELPNPFGTNDVPGTFSDFSVFKQIRILHQMTLFVMMNPERLREKMAEQKDTDRDQTTWRIEPFGWDRDDRVYYVLDDNRVYRLTDNPPAPPTGKKNTKKARAQARRNSKRLRTSSGTLDDEVEGIDSITQVDHRSEATDADFDDCDDDGLGGMKWECVAVSLGDLHTLLASIPGKKDPNERILHEKIVTHLLPILEQQEETRRRRDKERERELLNLAKMASAKRSNRIASRQEQQKQDEILREEERKRLMELEALRKEEQKRHRVERERSNRLLSREKRIHERQIRRAQHEEELAQLSEDSKSLDHTNNRLSERRRLAEIQKNKEALKELDEEGEEEWVFDCICGLHGRVDDGQHSVSCEKCNIWQHSRCLGIDEEEAEKDDFHFICDACKRRADRVANVPLADWTAMTINGNNGKAATEAGTPAGSPISTSPNIVAPQSLQFNINIPAAPSPKQISPAPGPQLIPVKKVETGQAGIAADNAGLQVLAPSLRATQQAIVGGDGPIKKDSSSFLSRPASTGEHPRGSTWGAGAAQEERGNASVLPHPDFSKPDQSPRKYHAYGTIREQHAPAVPSSPLPQAVVHLGSSVSTPSVASGNAQLARIQLTPTPLATPRLHHLQGSSEADSSTELSPSPLLPSRGGLSPTKHSPTIARDQGRGVPGTNLTPPIIPPAAALSPSAPEQILTPPVKPEGLAHRQSFSGLANEVVSSPAPDT